MLEIKNLSHVYQKGLPDEHIALTNINLTFPGGEVTALVGSTGSGKSTLVQHLNRLLTPTKGQIFLDGTDLKSLDRLDVCRNVGLVFQYPEHQLFEETVFDDVAFGPKNLGLGTDEIRERVTSALYAVGLGEDFFDKSPFELSGGEQRRAAIAGVIALRPRILILDEPVAGLDLQGKHAVFELIRNLRQARQDMTIIFVSHSMEDVALLAERVIVLNNGTVAADGSVSEIFAQTDLLEKNGLEPPPITQLIKKLRNMGYALPPDIFTAKDAVKAIKHLMGD